MPWEMSQKQLEDAAKILAIVAEYDHKDAIDLVAAVARIVWEKDKWEEVLDRVGRGYQWERPSFLKDARE